MPLHTCAECGLTHDHAGEYVPPVSDAVRIAELETHRDIEVARLGRAEERDYNETRVEVAEIEAAAEVETAAVQAEVIAEVIAAEGEASIEESAEGGAEPVIVEAIEPETPAEEPPPVIDTEPEPPAKKNVWWG